MRTGRGIETKWENSLNWGQCWYPGKRRNVRTSKIVQNVIRSHCSQFRIWLRSVFLSSDFYLTRRSFPKERVQKELYLLPALPLVKQDTIAGQKQASMADLSSVMCCGEERVDDEVEMANGHPKMTINQEASLPPLGHLSPNNSWMNLGVSALFQRALEQDQGSQVWN